VGEAQSRDVFGVRDVDRLYRRWPAFEVLLPRRVLFRAHRLTLSLCAMLAWATITAVEPATYRVDPEATQVEYVATALGILQQHGRFARVRGEIVLDAEGSRGRVNLEIDVRSVDSGFRIRDDFVQDEPMLDAAHHPTIRFRSSHLVYVEGRLATVGGALTLRGVTRPVELIVTRFVCRPVTGDGGETCDAAAQASLRRSEFGMDSYAPLIGDEIRLDFVVVAHRAPAADALR
jgi:polyisoprenoid-binding protein YceI